VVSVGPPAPELRIVFFGTPAFAVPVLEHLILSAHQVVGVVTQPDRPRGRGQQTTESPVKQVALAHELPVLQPHGMSEPGLFERLAAYGQILPQSLLDLSRFGMINVHASLLPKYRGAAPIHRAVMAGERETGVTIIRLIRELDAGPMLGALALPIHEDRTSEELERELAFLGAALLVSIVDDIAAGAAVETPQDAGLATYAARLIKADGAIDWTQPARRIHDQIRGLHPWPHAFTYLGNARYIILKSALGQALEARTAPPDAAGSFAGQILEASGDRLVVQCGAGDTLAITAIQAEGRRSQTVREFLSGRRLQAGQAFAAAPGPAPRSRTPSSD
jgi:methionyl-tRNA formyltransferase